MTDEIRLAFAHPSARAEATAGKEPLDRISLRNHTVEVEIGAFQVERGTTQRICFNIVVEVQPQTGRVDDDVDRILSYDALSDTISFELSAERLNLLETLAERVAERILLEPQAVRVFVRIEKLDRGPGALGVEIVRSRQQVPLREVGDPDLENVPHPRVVFLSNRAISAPNLSGWIDALQQRDAPVILCVGAAEAEAPRASNALAQRRIDLLAIEQNAWVLADRDKRCVVVGTRTEMDWAVKHEQMCVWAPSKMILDAVENTAPNTSDPIALAHWFALELEAKELLVIGAVVPSTETLPLRCFEIDQLAAFRLLPKAQQSPKG